MRCGRVGWPAPVMNGDNMIEGLTRREFCQAGAMAAAGSVFAADAKPQVDVLDVWQAETDLVSADVYREYMRDGDTRGQASLIKLERAFENVVREVRETRVDNVPAVWSVYNMGYVVKTRGSLFSIDLVHRRAAELAPQLDFALVTHNHSDHWRQGFYEAMDGAGKIVVSNFLDNYGATGWRKAGSDKRAVGGFTRAEKVFAFKDVEVRTSLVDHNEYLIDFTTAFEIRVGGWILYHTGDCGRGREGKLGTKWGRPDLWTFFPGCGINVAEAAKRVGPKSIAFGHLWELGHRTGRLTTPMVRSALEKVRGVCDDVCVPLWGERLKT